MAECFGRYFIKNGELFPSVEFDNSLVYEGESVYEVLRMVNGNPVFFHDHFQRLEKSVNILKKKMVTGVSELKKDIIKLAGADRMSEANLKIIFNYANHSSDYLVYFIEPVYPTGDQYNNGVDGILFRAERRDPASKVINLKLRSEIYHKLILEGAYEALLVNNNDCITEGSRSNIFFIRRNILYTAPEGIVLSGITRKYILEICREHGIEVVQECVNASRIGDYGSVFMSGTSPMILPFRMVDKISFDVKLPLMKELRKLYIEVAEKSIDRFLS